MQKKKGKLNQRYVPKADACFFELMEDRVENKRREQQSKPRVEATEAVTRQRRKKKKEKDIVNK